MNKKIKEEKTEPCAKNHAVHYRLQHGGYIRNSLKLQKVHIGQTGKCFNERAMEHNWIVANNAGGHPSELSKKCKCSPLLDCTKVLKKARGKLEHEILEAHLIRQAGDNCISTPSISLSDKE